MHAIFLTIVLTLLVAVLVWIASEIVRDERATHLRHKTNVRAENKAREEAVARDKSEMTLLTEMKARINDREVEIRDNQRKAASFVVPNFPKLRTTKHHESIVMKLKNQMGYIR